MSKFTYTGPHSAITLKLVDGTEQDVLLFTGKKVDVPAEHEAVKVLAAQGLLVPVPASAPEPALTPTPVPASKPEAKADAGTPAVKAK